jgi:excisionase family DNA binding protein
MPPVPANDNQPLLDLREAAGALGVSLRTLQRFMESGELPYIVVGTGRVRLRKKIAPIDLQTFKDSRRRYDAPCQSTATGRAPSTTMISKSEVFDSPGLKLRF